MSSRERTLAAINHQEPDRVPIFFRMVAPLSHLWRSNEERVDVLLALGADDKVDIEIPASIHPDVTVRDYFDHTSDPRYRLACREYQTPKGTLRMMVRCTEDCGYEDGVPLSSDHNVSRAVEFPIKSRDDLPKLAYLLQEPSKEDIAQFREEAQRKKKFADERGVLVEGYAGDGGDLAFCLCGANLYYLFEDDPDAVEELMDMSYDLDLKRMEIVLDEGVDTLYARGCYETAPMWSPSCYERIIAPRLNKKVELANQAGAKLSYFSTGQFGPHVDALLQTGVHIINGIRPFTGGVNDMRRLKKAIGHQVCLWGGLNPEEDVERGGPGDVRRKVVDLILSAAQGGGFVLSTGGSLYDETRYDNVKMLIEAANEFGRYPIDVGRLEAELPPVSQNLS